MEDRIDSQEINDIAERILSSMTEDDLQIATQLLETVDVSGILDEVSPDIDNIGNAIDNITVTQDDIPAFQEEIPNMILPNMADLDLLPPHLPSQSMRNINSSRASNRARNRIRKKTPRRRSTSTASPIIPSVNSRSGRIISRPQLFMDQVIPGSYDRLLPEDTSPQVPPVPDDFPSVSSRGRIRNRPQLFMDQRIPGSYDL